MVNGWYSATRRCLDGPFKLSSATKGNHSAHPFDHPSSRLLLLLLTDPTAVAPPTRK